MLAIVAVVGLAGCVGNRPDGESPAKGTSWALLGLLLAGLVVYLIFSGVMALRSRRWHGRGTSFDLSSPDVPSDTESAHAARGRQPPARRPSADTGLIADDTALRETHPRPPRSSGVRIVAGHSTPIEQCNGPSAYSARR